MSLTTRETFEPLHRKNQNRNAHVEVTPEIKRFRKELLARMPAWREMKIRIAHAKMMAERKGK